MINNPSPADWPGITRGALIWLNQVFRICFSLAQSGTTAKRPTEGLWVGRRYLDTTLGKPIWWKGPGIADWIDATGASV